MFPDLDRVLAAVLAARDTPAARRRVMDCRAVAVRLGEAEGVAWGEMILAGCRALNEYEARLRTGAPGGRRAGGEN